MTVPGANRRSSAGAMWAIAILPLALGGCAPLPAIEAALVIADLAAADRPSALKTMTVAPERLPWSWPGAGGASHGDLYRPATARAALVLVPGVAPEGKDDPRLVALATTLARVDFLVLVPDLPNLRALRVTPEDVGAIGAAAAALGRAEPSLPLGIAAISYAVGPAILAAMDTGLAERVAFVVGLGGYYDSAEVIRFFTTGAFRAPGDDGWQYLAPNAYGKWVFVRANTSRVADPRDRAILTDIADRKLADLTADVGALTARLGTEGRSIQALIDNADPARTEALLAQLPPPILADIEALNLARADFARLAARLILVHGRDDAIVPYSESLALAGAARPGQADLFLLNHLPHADLRSPGSADTIRLWRATYRLLAQRR